MKATFFFPLLAVAAILLILGLNSLSFITITPESEFTEDEESPIPEPATIMFAGDMMFDRYIRKKAEQNGYNAIFEKLEGILQRADLVVANLEGPITSHPTLHTEMSESSPHHYTFTFDPVVTESLSHFNIRAVSLGNNHILNFGHDGRAETTQSLNQAQIDYFGAPGDSQASIVELKNSRFGFVSFNEFSDDSISRTSEIIQSLEQSVDGVVVFAHWGDEYQKTPNDSQIAAAHAFVDAGADLVLGAHPHVIQSKETYRDVPIYYSLGNFVFDQYFNEDVRCGLLLEVTFMEGSVSSLQEHGTYLIEDGTTGGSDCANSYL